MTREREIVETFVQLADTLVDDFDVVEFLHGVAERCVQLLDCAEPAYSWPTHPAGCR
jgi:hypothetical protein